MDHSSTSVSYGRHSGSLQLEQVFHQHPEDEELIHHHRKSKKKSSSSKRSGVSSPGRGILKTPPTTEDFLRQNEELLLKHKRQLLQSRSAENTLERRRSDEEPIELEAETTSHRRSRSRETAGSIYATDPGSRRHHRHHRSSGEKKKKKSSSSSSSKNEEDVIYDRPKVPALKISKKSRKYSSPDEGLEDETTSGVDIGFYENLKYPEDMKRLEHIYSNDNSLYDVPRPGNKRIMTEEKPPASPEGVEIHTEPEEAIYINSDYGDNQDFYDVPKFRPEEPLTTIQEGVESIPPPPSTISEELYENYPRVNSPEECNTRTRPINRVENIYMNESYSDRGSSGYRSSPSIQSSEELYVNETAVPSEEEESRSEGNTLEQVLVSTPDFQRNLKEKKSNKTSYSKAPLDSDEQRLREIKREKERQKALLIEQEILKKREETKNISHYSTPCKKSSASVKAHPEPSSLTPPPPPFPTDFEEEDEEPKRTGNPLLPVSVDFEEFDIENPPVKPRILVVPEPKKKFTPKVEKNRSIEVYNETIRQRAQRKKTELNIASSSSEAEDEEDTEQEQELVTATKELKVQTEEAPRANKDGGPPSLEADDKDMPSVQKLRSRFESNHSKFNKSNKMGNSKSYDLGGQEEDDRISKPVNSAAKVFNVSAFQSNLKKKGGFRVMASLTRRSAVSISRALNEENNEINSSSASGVRRGEELNHHRQKARESTLSKRVSVSLLSNSKMFTRPQVNSLWDPTPLISSLYTLDSSSLLANSNESQKQNGGHHNYFEGYMDRLPSGKRKATIWNSWKTQYFVITRGTLTAYLNESKTEPLETFELFSGKIERMDTNVIGVTDRRGHFVLLRLISKSGKEDEEEELADKWMDLLQIHSKKDYSSTFIAPGAYDVSLLTKTIVVDFGGASVRAGIASRIPTLPKIFFPSIMAVARDNEREKYFGLDAFAPEVRARCDLLHPMSMDSRTVDLIAFQGMFEKIFKDLGIDDPAEYELQLSVPRSLNDKTKIALSSVLFEEFGIQSLNMAHQAVFAMYAYQSKTGIVVDIGERMDIIPIVDGYKVGSGMSRSPVGGRELRNRTAQYLQVKNHSLSPTSPVDDYVLRVALERSSYVARNFDRELEAYEDNFESPQAIPYGGAGKELSLGSERFEAIEGLFKPELWGLDQAGVHVLVHKAVRECPVDVRKEVTKSIYCSGGLASVPGFAERLELEMERLTPNVRPKVHASIYSYHAAYLGAESHALSEGFNDMKMSRETWYSSEGNHMARNWTL